MAMILGRCYTGSVEKNGGKGDIMDSKTAVRELKERVYLSIGISTEANELLDLLQFKSLERMQLNILNRKNKNRSRR